MKLLKALLIPIFLLSILITLCSCNNSNSIGGKHYQWNELTKESDIYLEFHSNNVLKKHVENRIYSGSYSLKKGTEITLIINYAEYDEVEVGTIKNGLIVLDDIHYSSDEAVSKNITFINYSDHGNTYEFEVIPGMKLLTLFETFGYMMDRPDLFYDSEYNLIDYVGENNNVIYTQFL